MRTLLHSQDLWDYVNKGLFFSLDTNIDLEGKLWYGNLVIMNRKWVIAFYAKNGETGTIEDVYFVLGLKWDLLSIGKLIEKGYIVLLKNNVCIILDKHPSKLLIAKVELTRNKMFPLTTIDELTTLVNDCKATSLDHSWMWNLRYGPFHFGSLDWLHKKQMVKGLPSI